MGSTGRRELTTQDIYDAIVGDSYINDPEYQRLSEISRNSMQSVRDIDDQMRELEKELENERAEKSPDELTVADEIEMLLGGKAYKYTERGEEINRQLEALRNQKNEIQQQWENANDRIRALDRAQVEAQQTAYANQTENTISTALKDSYQGFKLNESTTPYVDSALKEGKAFVVEMSPKQYLQEVAYKIFNSGTLETAIRGTSVSDISKYMTMMKQGVKFDTPYLNYKDNQQEGRHRAISAYLLGIERIPVIIIR